MARSYWLIWDAASKDITDKLLKEDVLPNLKKIETNGMYQRIKSKQLNCQTPCALAVQFAGQDASNLGIAGYNTALLCNNRPSIEYFNSFNNESVYLQAPWNNKNVSHKKIALCQIPYSQSLYENITSVECYRNHINSYSILYEDEVMWEKDELNKVAKLSNYIYGKESLSILINRGVQEQVDVQISSSTNSLSIELCKENNYMKVVEYSFDENIATNLFVVLRDDGNCVLLFSDVYDYEISDTSLKKYIKKFVGPFQGKGYGRIYRKSGFGSPRYLGGSGRAEEIFMFIVDTMAKSFQRLNNFFANNKLYDIVISYQPCIDEVSHEFYGWYFNAKTDDERSFYWELLKEAYIFADQHLGTLLNNKEETDNIIISSDHGIYPVENVFYINSWLKRHGLLQIDLDGNIDINKSKVFYHPAGNGAIYFDGEIKEKFIDELINIKIYNKTIIKELVYMDDDNKIFGDIYIIPNSGISINPEFNENIFEKARKTGSHTSNVEVSSLDGILSVASINMTRESSMLVKGRNYIYNTAIKELVNVCFQD